MKALRFIGGKLSVEEVGRPAGSSEAVMRVLRSGICNTDLEIVRGYADFEGTIGHEFVGVVEDSPGRPELRGQRVVGEINAGCGRCELCGSGDPRHCPQRTVLGIYGRDGAHAEFLTLPSENLIAVPEHVSNEAAVFVEPLAAAFGITERVDIGAQTRIAVIGDGKLGLLCAMALALRSEKLVLIGKHSSKLGIAARRNIETILLDDAIKLRHRFDVVVEASGAESGFDTALDLVRPRGTIVLKSTFHGRSAWEAWRVVVDEINVVGSRCGRLAPAVDLLARGEIDVGDLISEQLPLRDGVDAMERAARNGVMKVILNMEK